jgi:hypothetical protein
MYLPNQAMHIHEGGLHVVKPLVAIVSKLMRLKRIMVVKGFSNVSVEKQWRVVGIVQNRMQIMCVTEDDIDALKSKDWQ